MFFPYSLYMASMFCCADGQLLCTACLNHWMASSNLPIPISATPMVLYALMSVFTTIANS